MLQVLMAISHKLTQVNHNVRMDSHVLLTAARQVVSAAGFDDDLEATMNRVSDIEWLGRTRRLVLTKSV